MIRFTQRLVSRSFHQRLVWVRSLCFAAAAAIVVRTLYLQTVKRPAWELLAERQHSQAQSIKMQRGPIYDREGRILAISLPMDSWFAIPSEVADPIRTAKILSSRLSVDRDRLKKKLTAKVSFTWLKRNTKPTDSERVQKIDLPGIHRLKEYQRFYPSGRLAAQLIGFSGIDSQGLEGLEVQYDSHLMNVRSRHRGWEEAYRKVDAEGFSGGSLKLTIDSQLQYRVESELKKALTTMEAESGIAIVMESQTGAILAMANVPDFDPNNFERYKRSSYFNRAVGSVYEPGSTFKIITIASALENGIVRENDIFFCENGAYQIQDRTIHDIGSHGWLSVEKIVQKSSNICAAKIGGRIPRQVFHQMIGAFGFGRKTDIGLPGEVKGRVFDFRDWSETDVATISFGHTISATPIQLIAAINSIASGGYWIAPYVVAEARKADGRQVPLERPKKRRVLKPKTAEIVKRFMESVIQREGTGYSAHIPGVPIAGKTGTSEKFDSLIGEYSSDSYISSFVGFFPADRPEATVLIVVDDPKKKYLGRKGAAIVFKKVAERVIRFGKENRSKTRPSAVGKAVPLFPRGRLPDGKGSHFGDRDGRLKDRTLREVLLASSREGVALKVEGSGRLKKLVRMPNRESRFLAEFR